jgi:Flp pilus assembly protein TadG
MKTSDLRGFIRREEGSAIIEFIIYALPLFVPLVIYLTAINQSAQIQYEARNFARQLARAYVTSPSAEFTGARITVVKDVFIASSFAANKIDPDPRIEISCSLNPCLLPNGKVSVTVHLTSVFSHSSASATAVQTVDAWRSN